MVVENNGLQSKIGTWILAPLTWVIWLLWVSVFSSLNRVISCRASWIFGMFVRLLLHLNQYLSLLLKHVYSSQAVLQQGPCALLGTKLSLLIFATSCAFDMCACARAQPLSHVWLFVTSWTVAHQVEFSRQESWSCLPFPTPGDLPDLGMEPVSCIGRQTVYHCVTWEVFDILLSMWLNKSHTHWFLSTIVRQLSWRESKLTDTETPESGSHQNRILRYSSLDFFRLHCAVKYDESNMMVLGKQMYIIS